MKRLWAPWRMEYILDDKKHEICLFCDVSKKDKNRVNKTRDRKNLILFRGGKSFIMLNKYPYNSGHLMVVPYTHEASLEGLQPNERAEMMELAVAGEGVLREAYKPDGFNLGMNLGRAAGAGIEPHFHLHIVPRWSGDTNFMTVTAGTRVIPLDLRKTRDTLKRSFVERMKSGEGP